MLSPDDPNSEDWINASGCVTAYGACTTMGMSDNYTQISRQTKSFGLLRKECRNCGAPPEFGTKSCTYCGSYPTYQE